ncbi:MAG: hypothetical protein AAB847_01820 [Patescibacteria group bacterium]
MRGIFQQLIKENKLAHGYIFFGPDLKKQQELSQWLADSINDRPSQGPQDVRFDILKIEPVEESIGIDRIREIKSFLWQKPIQSLKRTIVVNEASCLTLEAQNAILKIAEEPPSHALIILLIRDHAVLLNTLVSRFQKIYLPSDLPDEALAKVGSSLSIRKYVNDFLKGGAIQRKNIIKDILEQEDALDDFVKFLMLELNHDPKKNWRVLKELLHRWTLICQYNVNKRLQMEAFTKAIPIY